MKYLLLVCFLTSFFTANSNKFDYNNETAELLEKEILRHEIRTIEVDYAKTLSEGNTYKTWSFPGANYITFGDKTYNLDYLRYFDKYFYKSKRQNIRKLTLYFEEFSK